jgi:hypothetical protein
VSNQFYARPILCVRDVEASIAYYCDKLGFDRDWASPEVKPIIAQVSRDGMDIILDSASVIPRAAIPSVVSVSVNDLSGLHRDFRERGAKVVAAPFAVAWQAGVLQFDIEDLDGNILVFWGDEAK